MSESAASRRRLSREERKAELLSHAIRVFARRGIGGARHAEIAEVAGVSVATAFVYFPTRDDLVRDVLTEVGRNFLDLSTAVHRSTEPVFDILLAHANHFAESVRTQPDQALVWLHWSTAIRGDTWDMYLDVQNQLLGLLATTIRRGQEEGSVGSQLDPDESARLCVAAAHMIAQLQLTGSSPDTIDGFVRTLVRATGAIATPTIDR